MGKWIGDVVKVLLVFALCITTTIWIWWSQHREPSMWDIFLSCFLIPSLLILLFMIWKRVLLKVLAKSAPSEKDVGQIPLTKPETVVGNADERFVSHSLSGFAIVTHIAEDAESLLELIKRGEDTFDLDSELLDEEGFPLITARVKSIEPEQTQRKFNAWYQSQSIEMTSTSNKIMNKVNWRTLSLLCQALDRLGEQIHSYLPFITSSMSSDNKLAIFPFIDVMVNLDEAIDANDEGLTPFEKGALQGWLLDYLLSWHWPANRMRLRVGFETNSENDQFWKIIQQKMRSLGRGDEPSIQCLVCADSMLSEASFSQHQHAKEWVPGEAASGVFIMPINLLAHFEKLEHAKVVMPLVCTLSAELQSKQIYSRMESELHEWLKLQEVNPSMLAGVVYSGSCTHQELVDWMVFANAFFEGTDSVLNLKECLGDVGISADLLALSLANALANKTKNPVLIVQKQAEIFAFCLVKPMQEIEVKQTNWEQKNFNDNHVLMN